MHRQLFGKGKHLHLGGLCIFTRPTTLDVVLAEEVEVQSYNMCVYDLHTSLCTIIMLRSVGGVVSECSVQCMV